MKTIEILKFVSFTYSLGITVIAFSLSNELRNLKVFKIFLWFTSLSFLLGIAFETTNLFYQTKGYTLLIMSCPAIYISSHKLLSSIFKKQTGFEPFSFFRGSKIGDKPIDGFWTRWESDRLIESSDAWFTFLDILLPFIIIFGLMIKFS